MVTDTFSLHERAKILRAVNEWNVVLNGFVRFEIMPAGNDATSGAHQHWVITSKQGGQSTGLATTLAATSPVADVGGLMVIYVERIGRRDLGGVVMHELGHVLGLGHSSKGGLMAARYHATSQQCVDRATVEAVAAKRGLPMARLNWCEAGQIAHASDGLTTPVLVRTTR
jgi:predicted Zn-dependent protease